MNKLVSIIMPAYNSSKYIEDSILSVINQTYRDWELIIINDCSIDDTLDICKKYKDMDDRIHIINLKCNKGVANARNIGIEFCKGRYIAFLDSDDIWKPEKLNKQMELITSKSVEFVFSSYEIICDDGLSTGKIMKAPRSVNYNGLLKGNCIGCLTVLIDSKKVKNLKMPLIKHEDYAAWLTILRENNIQALSVQESLAYYRKSIGSVSSNKMKALCWSWKIYHHHLKFSKIKSTLMLVPLIFNTLKKYK